MRDPITIRRSTGEDRRAVERLAYLDSATTPRGEALLAFEGGQLRAALPIQGGRPLADPFEPTAPLVDLLRLAVATAG